jgi:hypothetical protein
MPGHQSTQCAAKPSHPMNWLMKCGKGSAFLVLVVTANLSFGSLQQEDTVNSHSVVQLVCRDIVDNDRTISLGTLLSTDPKLQPEADIAIQEIQQGRGDSLVQDWAVITLDGRFEGASPRLKWHAAKISELTEFAERDGEVLVMRHANGESGRSCQTHIPTKGLRDENDGGKFLIADCTTFAGMSGA